MKAEAGLWLDQTRAYLIQEKGGEETLAIIPALIESRTKATGGHHPNRRHGQDTKTAGHKNENRRAEETKRFFRYLARELGHPKQLFLYGPGKLKNRFARFLKNDGCSDAMKINIQPTSSRLTLNQIRAMIHAEMV